MSPLNYFTNIAGPAAEPTMVLGWVFAGIATAVCIIIAVLLLVAMYRKRDSEDDFAASGKRGVRWIGIGTAISAAVLLGMAVYSLVVLNETAYPLQKPGLVIKVTGYDWWWRVEYEGFETANEIHIPVGEPVLVKLNSADVIHAFWVPKLAGKTQMIPGLNNQQWLQADKPGVYYGKCTQFCGWQHAHMDFLVIAEPRADYDKWVAAQKQPAKILAKADAGQRIFMRECSGCHAINGTKANGEHGPDLTHLASRKMIAAGMLPNSRENVMDWVEHVQEIKPGARMPEFKFNANDKQALANYLESLQ